MEIHSGGKCLGAVSNPALCQYPNCPPRPSFLYTVCKTYAFTWDDIAKGRGNSHKNTVELHVHYIQMLHRVSHKKRNFMTCNCFQFLLSFSTLSSPTCTKHILHFLFSSLWEMLAAMKLPPSYMVISSLYNSTLNPMKLELGFRLNHSLMFPIFPPLWLFQHNCTLHIYEILTCTHAPH